MYCNGCGTEIPNGAAFCPHCGNRTIEVMREKGKYAFGNWLSVGIYIILAISVLLVVQGVVCILIGTRVFGWSILKNIWFWICASFLGKLSSMALSFTQSCLLLILGVFIFVLSLKMLSVKKETSRVYHSLGIMSVVSLVFCLMIAYINAITIWR